MSRSLFLRENVRRGDCRGADLVNRAGHLAIVRSGGRKTHSGRALARVVGLRADGRADNQRFLVVVDDDTETAGRGVARGVGGGAADRGGAFGESGAGSRTADDSDAGVVVRGSDRVGDDGGTLARIRKANNVTRTGDRGR